MIRERENKEREKEKEKENNNRIDVSLRILEKERFIREWWCEWWNTGVL